MLPPPPAPPPGSTYARESSSLNNVVGGNKKRLYTKLPTPKCFSTLPLQRNRASALAQHGAAAYEVAQVDADASSQSPRTVPDQPEKTTCREEDQLAGDDGAMAGKVSFLGQPLSSKDVEHASGAQTARESSIKHQEPVYVPPHSTRPEEKRKRCHGGCGKSYARNGGRNKHWKALPDCRRRHEARVQETRDAEEYNAMLARQENFVMWSTKDLTPRPRAVRRVE